MEVLLDARVLLAFTADMIPAAFRQQGSRQFALAEEPPNRCGKLAVFSGGAETPREGDDEKKRREREDTRGAAYSPIGVVRPISA
jgi:hypothetical protein